MPLYKTERRQYYTRRIGDQYSNKRTDQARHTYILDEKTNHIQSKIVTNHIHSGDCNLQGHCSEIHTVSSRQETSGTNPTGSHGQSGTRSPAVDQRSPRERGEINNTRRRRIRDIKGAPTVHVLLDYIHVWEVVKEIVLREDTPDVLLWRCIVF